MIRQRVLRGTLLGAALVIAAAAPGCGRLAVWTAPAKAPTVTRTAAAVEADKLFWKTLHAWIAPHNFEGFFLNFGDMLVKAGQPDLGVTMYRNAQLAREYPAWPYKAVLEAPIRDAAKNVEAFRRAEPGPDAATLMIRSTFACMGCHRE